eukprot:TRINITY_DN4039_c0_g1_i1.p1 TRINITY_DN4039_c0_g1~~TRINITY_DN4039_c0_g1_i1.p1  ORF type:complete len:684 (+),score=242.55 TRINITY_DN4039_c0_g1_i1:75-2054(+)
MASTTPTRAVLLATLVGTASANAGLSDQSQAANPVRKIVRMLEKLSEKADEEAKTEKELYDKFMCHCKSELADFNKGKASFEAAVPQLEGDISSTEAQISTLQQEIEAQRADEAAASSTMESAESQRSKAHTSFEKDVTEDRAAIKAISDALPAIERAMGGGFLQTAKQVLSKLPDYKIEILKKAVSNSKGSEEDKQTMASFLEGQTVEGGVGSVGGLMKNMKADLQGEVNTETEIETKEVNVFKQLMQAKKDEKETIAETVADKIERQGELKVALVELKGQLSDAQNSLGKDFAVLEELSKSCKQKTVEYDARTKSRSEEVLAIADTIKILEEGDAASLAQQALPATSLVQFDDNRNQASKIIADLSEKSPKDTKLNLIALALTHKGVDFTKVTKMIDNMVELLKKEQKDDETKREYCNTQFFETGRKNKALTSHVAKLSADVSTKTEAVETLAAEMKALTEGIAGLDKSIAEATEQRKAEHAEYAAMVQENQAAQELIGRAKTRLAKTFAPEASFLQVASHHGSFSAVRSAGGEKIVHMLSGLIQDLAQEVKIAKVDEASAQTSYEKLVANAKEKRAADTQAIAGKNKAKAEFEEEKVQSSSKKASQNKQLKALASYEEDLHQECDFMLKNFEARRTARTEEQESLGDAKAALFGAQ